MPKRKPVPEVAAQIPVAGYKNRKRRLKQMEQIRMAFGKESLFDTDAHKARYPLEDIAIVLFRLERKAIKIRKHLDFCWDERQLWFQMFTDDEPQDPARKSRQE